MLDKFILSFINYDNFMKDKSNNKDFILKRLIYRSKYTGTKETDILLSILLTNI